MVNRADAAIKSVQRINSLIRARSRGTFARFLIHHSDSFTKMYKTLLSIDKKGDFSFRMVRVIMFMLRSTTAISYLFFPLIYLLELTPQHFGGWIPFSILATWMFIEMMFFVYSYITYVKFNASRPHLIHIAQNQEERKRLLNQCFTSIGDGCLDRSPKAIEGHLRNCIEQWFLDAPLDEIRMVNVEMWGSFAFFNKDFHEMTEQDLEDNRELIRILEDDYLHYKFAPGYCEYTPAMRLNFDPLVANQRPFAFYFIVVVLNTITSSVLHFLLGFSVRSTHCKTGVQMYHRKIGNIAAEERAYKAFSEKSFVEKVHDIFDNSSCLPDDSERQALQAQRQAHPTAYPIVFIHGLGIGFAHYIFLIAKLPRDRDVYLVEMPYVCMRINAPPPKLEDAVDAIVEILTADGYAPPRDIRLPFGEEAALSGGVGKQIAVIDPSTPAPKGTPRGRSPRVKAVAGARGSSRSRSRSRPRSKASRWKTSQGSEVDTTSNNLKISAASSHVNPSGKTPKRLYGACFVAHSLGTAAVSWMLHNKEVRDFVHSTVLVDPVTFLLSQPKVCATYVHPDPKCTGTYISSYILARELYISNALSRHFNWSQNAIFLEDLPGSWEHEVFDPNRKNKLQSKFLTYKEFSSGKVKRSLRSSIILAKGDTIIPFESVCQYFDHRATGIYHRAYGASGEKDFHPDVRTIVDDGPSPRVGAPSPRPLSAVYRSRSDSKTEDEVSYFKNQSHVQQSAPCWFEWTILDCSHGEQMMVTKFIDIIVQKSIQQSTVYEDDE